MLALLPCLTMPPPIDWKSDLAIMRRALDELHPGLYRYQTRQQYEQNWKHLESRLGASTDLKTGYVAVSEFLNTIKCGHTYANFFNQDESVRKAVFEGKNKVPFTFRWFGERMIVTAPVGSAPLARGTEVLSINGVPVGNVKRKLMQVARADGSNDAKRSAYLEVGGGSEYEAFDIYHPLYFDAQGPKLNLRVKQPGKSLEQLTVEAIDLETRKKLADEATGESDPKAPLWSDKMLSPGVAYLKMPTWALFNSKWTWRTYLRGFFDRVVADKVPNLIIDIRGNEGGNEVGPAILERLADRRYELGGYDYFLRYRKVPTDLLPYLDTWDPQFRDWGPRVAYAGPDKYRLVRESGEVRTIEPSDSSYRGKVFILMGATNSSATFTFCRDIKQTKLGTLIGQTTGGNLRGINGGAFFFAKLPSSKIEFDIPLVASVTKEPMPDAGVDPDVYVKPNPDIVVSGRDDELETALRIIGPTASQRAWQ